MHKNFEGSSLLLLELIDIERVLDSIIIAIISK